MNNPWQDDAVIQLSQRIVESFESLLDYPLDNFSTDPLERSFQLYHAPYVVLAHDGASDPRFTYGNLTAQTLWEMPWHELVGMPSRYSAEKDLREVRAQMLSRVKRDGYIDDYQGIRISKQGKRFQLGKTIVWNLLDDEQQKCGQAATFSQWTYLDEERL